MLESKRLMCRNNDPTHPNQKDNIVLRSINVRIQDITEFNATDNHWSRQGWPCIPGRPGLHHGDSGSRKSPRVCSGFNMVFKLLICYSVYSSAQTRKRRAPSPRGIPNAQSHEGPSFSIECFAQGSIHPTFDWF